MSDHEHLLKTEELTKLFGGLRAIDRISLTLREGEAVGVIGPNGSGKSTLLNVVMGVYAPDGGRVVYAGEDITGLPPEAIARRGIGCAFQIAGPFAEMTVLENMLVAGLAQPKNSRRERALELLDLVSLADLRQHKAGNISFGQTKLLELARLLMQGCLGQPDGTFRDGMVGRAKLIQVQCESGPPRALTLRSSLLRSQSRQNRAPSYTV